MNDFSTAFDLVKITSGKIGCLWYSWSDVILIEIILNEQQETTSKMNKYLCETICVTCLVAHSGPLLFTIFNNIKFEFDIIFILY